MLIAVRIIGMKGYTQVRQKIIKAIYLAIHSILHKDKCSLFTSVADPNLDMAFLGLSDPDPDPVKNQIWI